MHERMMDKSTQPSDEDMVNWIGQPIAEEWIALRRFLAETYDIVPIFNSGGKRYGWDLQYRIGGRPLCEMYPEHGSFTALVILGKDELGQAMDRIESFGPVVRQALEESPRYHDGCWMYIRVSDSRTWHQDVQDIEELILIKRKPLRKKMASAWCSPVYWHAAQQSVQPMAPRLPPTVGQLEEDENEQLGGILSTA